MRDRTNGPYGKQTVQTLISVKCLYERHLDMADIVKSHKKKNKRRKVKEERKWERSVYSNKKIIK